jgi:putative transposase
MVAEAMREEGFSLRKALRHTGCSRKAYYHQARKRCIPLDPYIVEKTRQIAMRRQLYGTRRMAAQLSRELGVRVNRKRVQRIYRQLGWTQPQQRKNDLLRTAVSSRPKPTKPNELWEADLTYIHCGIDGWGYSFNVEDVVSREWVSYVFDKYAVKENAILSVEKALIKHPEAIGIRLRTDHGSQYGSRAFKESMRVLGVRQEFIAVNTPEQNGHMESFHRTLKREYVWTRDFQSFQDAAEALQEAYLDYNQNRIHSALGYITPLEYLAKIKVTENDS